MGFVGGVDDLAEGFAFRRVFFQQNADEGGVHAAFDFVQQENGGFVECGEKGRKEFGEPARSVGFLRCVEGDGFRGVCGVVVEESFGHGLAVFHEGEDLFGGRRQLQYGLGVGQ